VNNAEGKESAEVDVGKRVPEEQGHEREAPGVLRDTLGLPRRGVGTPERGLEPLRRTEKLKDAGKTTVGHG